MPPQVRRRPLGPPSAITTGVSQRRSGGGLEGMGNSILSAAISQLLSGSDGDEDSSTLSPVPASRFLAQGRDTIGTGMPDSGGFLPSTGSTIGQGFEDITGMLENRRRRRRL